MGERIFRQAVTSHALRFAGVGAWLGG